MVDAWVNCTCSHRQSGHNLKVSMGHGDPVNFEILQNPQLFLECCTTFLGKAQWKLDNNSNLFLISRSLSWSSNLPNAVVFVLEVNRLTHSAHPISTPQKTNNGGKTDHLIFCHTVVLPFGHVVILSLRSSIGWKPWVHVMSRGK